MFHVIILFEDFDHSYKSKWSSPISGVLISVGLKTMEQTRFDKTSLNFIRQTDLAYTVVWQPNRSLPTSYDFIYWSEHTENGDTRGTGTRALLSLVDRVVPFIFTWREGKHVPGQSKEMLTRLKKYDDKQLILQRSGNSGSTIIMIIAFLLSKRFVPILLKKDPKCE